MTDSSGGEQINDLGVSGAASALEPFRVTSSDGLAIVGDVAGEVGAPEILFIHGVRQSRLSWVKQFDSPELAGFRRVRFDLRGHGDSDKPEDPARYGDLDLLADDVAAVIEATKLVRPVIVGWSKGGYVTGGYLRHHGDAKVAGVNLVDAYVTLSADYLTPRSLALAKDCASQDLQARTAATQEFLLACFHRSPVGADLQRLMVINGMAPRAVSENAGGGPPPDLLPVFGRFTKPLLVSYGLHDELVLPEMAQAIAAAHSTATLSAYENSGHSPHFEEAERFNRELAAFVADAWRSPA